MPNALIGASFLISLIRHVDVQGFSNLYLWLAGAVVPIFLTFIFFKLRMLGASDVKLFAIVGSFLGIPAIFKVLIYSLFAGGILSVLKILFKKNARKRFCYLQSYVKSCVQKKELKPYYNRKWQGEDGIIPFTVAISIATLLSL